MRRPKAKSNDKLIAGIDLSAFNQKTSARTPFGAGSMLLIPGLSDSGGIIMEKVAGTGL
jgi:hypothetical protein